MFLGPYMAAVFASIVIAIIVEINRGGVAFFENKRDRGGET